MGRGGHLSEIISVSGILKIVEFILLFITALLHRHGDHGKYLFFGTSAIQMKANYYDKGDIGMDLENFGNGTLVTFMITSSVLLICYVLDGRIAIQSLFLEYVWNFLGFVSTTAVGANSLLVWTQAKANDPQAVAGNYENFARNYDSALAMGALLIITGIVYFIDFVIAVIARRRFRQEAY